MCKLIWVIALGSIVLPSAATAEIYKWKDGDVIRYSDLPPKNKEYEPLKAKKPGNGSIQAAATAGTDAAKTDAAKTTGQKDTDNKAKEKACASAKENLGKLKQGGIIYKENAKGEREYLDENSIKTELAAAEKEAALACK